MARPIVRFARKSPHGFMLAIMVLMLLLLAGYLFLADIVPKQGESPIKEQTPSTASSPEPTDGGGSWQSYIDTTFAFSLRYPENWFASVDTSKGYSVRFTDGNSGDKMSITVVKNGDAKTILASLRKQSAHGLFQAETTGTISLINGIEAPVLINYASPRGDMLISNAVVERDGNVFVFEERHRSLAPPEVGLFDLWVRSFTI